MALLPLIVSEFASRYSICRGQGQQLVTYIHQTQTGLAESCRNPTSLCCSANSSLATTAFSPILTKVEDLDLCPSDISPKRNPESAAHVSENFQGETRIERDAQTSHLVVPVVRMVHNRREILQNMQRNKRLYPYWQMVLQSPDNAEIT